MSVGVAFIPRTVPAQTLQCSSVFEPLGDEPLAGVDIDLPEWPIADIYELMRRLRRNDDDLPRLPLECLRANGKERAALLDDEDLFLGMLVQLRSPSRWEINPDEGDAAIPVQVALELVAADAFANIIPV